MFGRAYLFIHLFIYIYLFISFLFVFCFVFFFFGGGGYYRNFMVYCLVIKAILYHIFGIGFF